MRDCKPTEEVTVRLARSTRSGSTRPWCAGAGVTRFIRCDPPVRRYIAMGWNRTKLHRGGQRRQPLCSHRVNSGVVFYCAEPGSLSRCALGVAELAFKFRYDPLQLLNFPLNY